MLERCFTSFIHQKQPETLWEIQPCISKPLCISVGNSCLLEMGRFKKLQCGTATPSSSKEMASHQLITKNILTAAMLSLTFTWVFFQLLLIFLHC